MYKAGQIITICNMVCQVKKVEVLKPVCRECAFFHGPISVCLNMCGGCYDKMNKLPKRHYFKFLKYVNERAKSAKSSTS